MLLLLSLVEFLVEDLVDLSASDLFDFGDVIFLIPSNFTGDAICWRFIRTSLEPCLGLPSVGRLACVLQFLLSLLAV